MTNVSDYMHLSIYGGGTAPLDNCINLDTLRKFRDVALYNTTFGVNYINNYYLIGTRIGSLDLTSSLQSASVGYNVMQAIMQLMNSSTSTSRILVDSSFKTELINLLNLYKTKTTDTAALSALDDVINDVNTTFYNKTVGDLRILMGM